jgi:hypothetical protein
MPFENVKGIPSNSSAASDCKAAVTVTILFKIMLSDHIGCALCDRYAYFIKMLRNSGRRAPDKTWNVVRFFVTVKQPKILVG